MVAQPMAEDSKSGTEKGVTFKPEASRGRCGTSKPFGVESTTAKTTTTTRLLRHSKSVVEETAP